MKAIAITKTSVDKKQQQKQHPTISRTTTTTAYTKKTA